LTSAGSAVATIAMSTFAADDLHVPLGRRRPFAETRFVVDEGP